MVSIPEGRWAHLAPPLIEDRDLPGSAARAAGRGSEHPCEERALDPGHVEGLPVVGGEVNLPEGHLGLANVVDAERPMHA